MMPLTWSSSHALIILLAIGTLFSFFWIYLMKDRLGIHWYTAMLIAILHTVFGVLCVKTFAIAEVGFRPSIAGNMSLFGGVFFMPLFYLVLSKILKKPTAAVYDVFTICMIVTLMCARVNCLVAGCCKGIPFFREPVLWPTRELELCYYVVAGAWLAHRVDRNRAAGTAYPLYMISYGVFRFLVEWVRESNNSSVVHLAHLWAILSVCLGWFFYKLAIQHRQVKKRS